MSMQAENIRRIDTPRDDLYAFEVTGHITAADVEAVYGLLAEAYERHPRVDLLIRLVGYDGWDWNVISRETTMIAKTRALRHIRRYAVVGGPGWIAGMVRLFDPLLSIEMKHFDAGDEAAAWTWLDAAEPEG